MEELDCAFGVVTETWFLSTEAFADDLEDIRGRSRLGMLCRNREPNYSTQRGSACLSFVRDTVTELKQKYPDLYIVVMGDFNQWNVAKALEDFPDLVDVPVGNMRGNRFIDKILTNLAPEMKTSGTVPPLEPDLPDVGSPCDHQVAYIKCEIQKVRKFKWLSYSYRYLNDESTEMTGHQY